MKQYQDPILKVIRIGNQDVISTSGDIQVYDAEINDSNVSNFGWRVAGRQDFDDFD